MDNNNTPNVVHNADNNGSSFVVVTPVIDIGPTSLMESNDPNRQPPMTAEAQQELVDMLMTVEENDDMPSLLEVSSTESDIELAPNLAAQDTHVPISEQTDVRNAISQSTAFSTPSPPSSSSSPAPQRSNRRARVEDDIDDNRDRRHPSQRVGASDHPFTPNAPPNSFFGPFFTSFRDAGAALRLELGNGYFNRTTTANPSRNSSTPNINSNHSNPNPTPGASTSSSQSQNQGPPQNPSGAPDRPPMHVVDYEFSIVMDGSRRPQPVQGAPNQAPALNVQGQPPGTPSGPSVAGTAGAPPNISFNPPIPLGNLATLLGIPFPLPGGGFGFPPMPEEKEDPERARKLVDGLDEVPVGLVRRLEKVGTGGGGMGEDVSKGGDVGCAVCWDRLLPEEVATEKPSENQEGNEGMIVDEEAGKGTNEEHPESKYPSVVSLPCAHVFHAECLIPWFSRPRHTTCPTCRFNIDPDNLTYVSARQRRQELRRAANDNTDNNDNNDLNQPSEGTTGERLPYPASATPATAATTDAGEQPPQPQGRVVDLGGGFAGILQMLNTQGQPQQQPPAAPDNVAVPSGPEPQLQGLPPPNMPTPMPIGGAGNFFPAGFAVGQLPMPMPIPVPFMAVPIQMGNTEGIPMPMPWRMMADPFHMATGGGTRTNATGADASDASVADDANATPATTTNEPSSSNVSNAPQAPHRPAIDVIRISVDMVFDGRPMRPANQGPTNNSAVPQSAGGNTNLPEDAHNATQEQLDDGDHDFDDEPPELLSLEEAEEQDRQIAELLDRMRRSRQNHANGGNAPAPAPNSEQPTPQTQPTEPGPQFHGPPGYSLGDIHVAGTGRSFEEAFTQALSRLQDQIAQPRQEGENPQPAAAAAANENIPPPPPQQTQAGAQAQGQLPWHFMTMPMPFMNFGIPMRPSQPEGPKRAWAPPPPPGPTLRQRIERREWEAGLRCHDVSCGLGPSDEDPLGDDVCDTLRKGQQLSILSNEEYGEGARMPVCEHRFHGTCLVSAERVALRGAAAIMNEAGGVEVSCPVCRGTGCVTKAQWDEGVLALQ